MILNDFDDLRKGLMNKFAVIRRISDELIGRFLDLSCVCFIVCEREKIVAVYVSGS